jgi:phosphate transport system permease protein
MAQTNHVSLYRQATNMAASFGAAASAVIVIVPLMAVFGYLLYKGIGSINLAFLTHTPKPVGEVGGGMANAIVGSVFILFIGSFIGVPLGIGAGVYLSEYGKNRYSTLVRFSADVLNGVPSIVIGLAAYALVVLRQGHFSAYAGGVALGIMMIPTIARTTEEMLLMVPYAVREAALGLGIPQWRSTISVALRTARPGIITGVMLAFARVAGETAPLIFTAFGNQFWNLNPSQPTAALPLQVYVYALSPFDDWIRQAWAGALILIVLIVVAVTVVRLATRRGSFAGSN